GVEPAEGGALGADEAFAEDVVAVSARTGDGGALDGEGEAAGGLAEGADTRCGAGVVRHGPSPGRLRRRHTDMGRAGWKPRPGRAYRPVRTAGRCRTKESGGERRRRKCGRPSLSRACG